MGKIIPNLIKLENSAISISPMTKNRNARSTKNIGNEYPKHVIVTICQLKSLIDQYHTNSKNAKALILGLANDLDKEGLCEKSQICRRIKNILEDKFKEKKSQRSG
jgi:hypothetical protein